MPALAMTASTSADEDAWLAASSERTVADAVAHFHPGCNDHDWKRHHNRMTQRRIRAKKRPAVVAVVPSPPPAPPPKPPRSTSSNGAELPPLEFWTRELERVQGDIDAARADGQFRAVPPLLTRMQSIRASLDEARAAAARQGVKVERSVRAVAKELRERARLLEMLEQAGVAGEGE